MIKKWRRVAAEDGWGIVPSVWRPASIPLLFCRRGFVPGCADTPGPRTEDWGGRRSGKNGEIIFYSSRWTETWKGLARELALPVCQLRQLLSLTGFVVFCSSACSFLFFFPQIKRLFVRSEKVQMLCFSLSAFLITPSSNGFVI